MQSFYKKLNYSSITFCNNPVCNGIYFSHELSFQSVQLTKILFTRIFSRLSVLCRVYLLTGNSENVSKSGISILVGSLFTGMILFYLYLFTFHSPCMRAKLCNQAELCCLVVLGPRISYLMSLNFRFHLSKNQENTYLKGLLY